MVLEELVFYWRLRNYLPYLKHVIFDNFTTIIMNSYQRKICYLFLHLNTQCFSWDALENLLSIVDRLMEKTCNFKHWVLDYWYNTNFNIIISEINKICIYMARLAYSYSDINNDTNMDPFGIPSVRFKDSLNEEPMFVL